MSAYMYFYDCFDTSEALDSVPACVGAAAGAGLLSATWPAVAFDLAKGRVAPAPEALTSLRGTKPVNGLGFGFFFSLTGASPPLSSSLPFGSPPNMPLTCMYQMKCQQAAGGVKTRSE